MATQFHGILDPLAHDEDSEPAASVAERSHQRSTVTDSDSDSNVNRWSFSFAAPAQL